MVDTAKERPPHCCLLFRIQDCLAGLGIVHSDLAARNVYIDQSHTLKVSDFGIVSDGKRDEVYVNGRPLRWLSPEVLVNHAYSTASDIWAFGVTLWEIITLGKFLKIFLVEY